MSSKNCAKNAMSRGRPLTYTTELARKILDRLATGESLRSICRDDHMPAESTVRAWAQRDVDGFRDRFVAARDLGLDMIAGEVVDIADNPSLDLQSIRRDRLRINVRKWHYSRIAPKNGGNWAAADRETAVTINVVYRP